MSHDGAIGSRTEVLDYGVADPTVQARIEKLLIVIFIAAAIGFSIAPITNQIRKMRQHEDGTKDYPLWYDTGYREWHGISPYYRDRNREFPFMYPPGAAAVLAPLSLIGKLPMVMSLVLLNTAAWATCILAPIYLVSGRVRGLHHVLYWLPSLICCVYIWDTYLEGQMAFCLSACLLGMMVFLQQEKPMRAGFLLALAAGFKAFPILALPYLIYRRHWKAVGYTAVFLFLFAVVLPACLRGPRGAWDDLKTWNEGIMSPNTPKKMGAASRGARSYTWQNGSLLAVTHRLLRNVVADSDDNVPPMKVNFADLKFKTVNHIATGLSLLLCIGYLAVTRRERDRTCFSDAAEMAILLILIILFAPMSFTYNNAWLMFGMVVVLYWITTNATQAARPMIAWLTLALLPLLFSVSTSINWWRHLRAMGNTFLADVLLMIQLAWLIATASKNPDANLNGPCLSPAQRSSNAKQTLTLISTARPAKRNLTA